MDRARRLLALQESLREMLSALDEMDQAGEQLNDEESGQIADEIAAIYDQIDVLQGEEQGPPPADAQLLWILSGQNEDAFINYLRTYPSAQTNALLNNPTALSVVIRQLTQMMPPGEAPVVDGIAHADLNSSNIWGSAYDPKTRRMKVRFQGGSEYEYDGVPPNIYRAFASGNAAAKTSGKNQYGEWWRGKFPSLGSAMNQFIKTGKFNYRKLK